MIKVVKSCYKIRKPAGYNPAGFSFLVKKTIYQGYCPFFA